MGIEPHIVRTSLPTTTRENYGNDSTTTMPRGLTLHLLLATLAAGSFAQDLVDVNWTNMVRNSPKPPPTPVASIEQLECILKAFLVSDEDGQSFKDAFKTITPAPEPADCCEQDSAFKCDKHMVDMAPVYKVPTNQAMMICRLKETLKEVGGCTCNQCVKSECPLVLGTCSAVKGDQTLTKDQIECIELKYPSRITTPEAGLTLNVGQSCACE